jgi:hypothetical protein
MPLHCLFPSEADVLNPNPSLPLVGKPGYFVSYGYSDEYVIVLYAQLTHISPVGGGTANAMLNRVATPLDFTGSFRQDWAVAFDAVQGGWYSLDLTVQTYGGGVNIRSFQVEIPDLVYEGVATILWPNDNAIVDDRHFLCHGQLVGVSVLTYVRLRNAAGVLDLNIQYPRMGTWVARWVGVPASHQNAPVTLAAKPPGGPEIVRTITIQRLAARNA